MAYYLTLFYPPSRTGKRIGQYFTAARKDHLYLFFLWSPDAVLLHLGSQAQSASYICFGYNANWSTEVSAVAVGLVSAGFQKLDGLGGLVGFQWMFLLYGICAVVLGFVLLWWLPDRPLPPGQHCTRNGFLRWLPPTPPGEQVHLIWLY